MIEYITVVGDFASTYEEDEEQGLNSLLEGFYPLEVHAWSEGFSRPKDILHESKEVLARVC